MTIKRSIMLDRSGLPQSLCVYNSIYSPGAPLVAGGGRTAGTRGRMGIGRPADSSCHLLLDDPKDVS